MKYKFTVTITFEKGKPLEFNVEAESVANAMHQTTFNLHKEIKRKPNLVITGINVQRDKEKML